MSASPFPNYCDNDEQPSCVASTTPFTWTWGRKRYTNHHLSLQTITILSHTFPSKLRRTPHSSLTQQCLSQTPDYASRSLSNSTSLPFRPSNNLDIVVVLKSQKKMWNIVRILLSIFFLLLLFYQEQYFHGFSITFRERSLMRLNWEFQVALVLWVQLWNVYQWSESVSFLCQAGLVPWADDEWKTVQNPTWLSLKTKKWK